MNRRASIMVAIFCCGVFALAQDIVGAPPERIAGSRDARRLQPLLPPRAAQGPSVASVEELLPYPQLGPGARTPFDLWRYAGRVPGASSFGRPDLPGSFTEWAQMNLERKAQIMAEVRAYMRARYDFSAQPVIAPGGGLVMMGGGRKPVMAGPVARLPEGIASWEALAALGPADIRARDLFPTSRWRIRWRRPRTWSFRNFGCASTSSSNEVISLWAGWVMAPSPSGAALRAQELFTRSFQQAPYGKLARESHGRIVLAGCWAHARRKFVEAQALDPRFAAWIVRQPRPAGAGRDDGDQGEPPAGRVSPRGGGTRQNAIRPSALGKKYWLFVGSPRAGPWAATIYSLTESCRRCVARSPASWRWRRDAGRQRYEKYDDAAKPTTRCRFKSSYPLRQPQSHGAPCDGCRGSPPRQ